MRPTPRLEVSLTPADFGALRDRDLSQTVCVVFDILRATSSMITALANGATEIIPVAEIDEALAFRARRPDVLLAGEREGLRIRGPLSGGVDFDLGNSPREFTAARVRGRSIVMTTTNGTRALRACSHARTVLIGSFQNLRAITQWLQRENPLHLILVCSGTYEEAALEDTLAAGAVCERVWPQYSTGHIADSAEIARRIYPLMQMDLFGAMRNARNGRRLLAHPELSADVRFCVEREIYTFLAGLQPDGSVRRME